MRVVVTGATGNVGTSLLAALAREPLVRQVIGIARRAPEATFAKARFVQADVGRDALDPYLVRADAVVHLAWKIHSSHEPAELWQTNVEGSRRVFEAALRAEVPHLIYASSAGAYSPGPKDRLVDETWPTAGVESSHYSRQKAAVERLLDEIEDAHPSLRVVRLRPALIFKRAAASHLRALFLGSLVPRFVFDQRYLRLVPDHPALRLQVVHAADVADAYRRALLSQVRGAFNVAADPVLDSKLLAELLDGRRVRVSPRLLRGLARAGFLLRLQPAEPGWIDLAFRSPLLDCSRIRSELDWAPRRSAQHTLLEVLDGLREGADFATPPLESHGGLGAV